MLPHQATPDGEYTGRCRTQATPDREYMKSNRRLHGPPGRTLRAGPHHVWRLAARRPALRVPRHQAATVARHLPLTRPTPPAATCTPEPQTPPWPQVAEWCLTAPLDTRVILCGYDTEHDALWPTDGAALRAKQAEAGYSARRDNGRRERLWLSPRASTTTSTGCSTSRGAPESGTDPHHQAVILGQP